jgi:hypothetical protein
MVLVMPNNSGLNLANAMRSIAGSTLKIHGADEMKHWSIGPDASEMFSRNLAINLQLDCSWCTSYQWSISNPSYNLCTVLLLFCINCTSHSSDWPGWWLNCCIGFECLFLEHAYCTCSQLFPDVTLPSDREQYCVTFSVSIPSVSIFRSEFNTTVSTQEACDWKL